MQEHLLSVSSHAGIFSLQSTILDSWSAAPPYPHPLPHCRRLSPGPLSRCWEQVQATQALGAATGQSLLFPQLQAETSARRPQPSEMAFHTWLCLVSPRPPGACHSRRSESVACPTLADRHAPGHVIQPGALLDRQGRAAALPGQGSPRSGLSDALPPRPRASGSRWEELCTGGNVMFTATWDCACARAKLDRSRPPCHLCTCWGSQMQGE